MKMIHVNSSAINAIGYDNGSMKITFNQGKTYNYCNVPKTVFDDFLNASSVGRYYDLNIKNKYNCW